MINIYRRGNGYMKTDQKENRAKERKPEILADLRIDYFPCLFLTASSYRTIFTLFILFPPIDNEKYLEKERIII